MITYLMIAGGLVAGWAILLVMAGERQRQLNELEVQQQIAEQAAMEAAKSKQKPRRKAA